jgi:uncharacterized protein GlcG (DUF336 family)
MIAAAIDYSRTEKFKPMTFCVLDTGGHLISAQRQDGSGNLRYEIAFGKAWGALGVGHSTRWLMEDLGARFPLFVQSMMPASNGRVVPMLGGVLIREADGVLLGAMGATGELAAKDEAVVIHAIQSCDLVADLS